MEHEREKATIRPSEHVELLLYRLDRYLDILSDIPLKNDCDMETFDITLEEIRHRVIDEFQRLKGYLQERGD